MKNFNIPFSPPDIGEEEINEVIDTLKSGWITTGPKTKQLEKELSTFTETKKTVCLNSATAGLELVLRVLGVGEGDEVIVPALTYTASCSVIYHVGAKAVMVDIAKDNIQFDYEKLEEAITEKTKVIIPVDLAGVPCDYDKIFEIVERKKYLFKANSDYQEKMARITVLADGAHALGSSYKGKKVGSVADFTAFSFHAVKNFTTAEGGSITWRNNENFDDEQLYKEFQILSLHGQSKDALSKMKAGAWEYDIVTTGYKCNMTDIAASLGLAQLKKYSQCLKRRREIVDMYNKEFYQSSIIPLNHVNKDKVSSYHLYITNIDGIGIHERNKIIEIMAERGISCNVHYKPLSMLTAYKNLGFKIDDYPNAYKYYECEITLPLNTKLTDEEIRYVSKTYKEVVQEIVNG